MKSLRNSVAFYVGLHQPKDARHFLRACISINRLWGRKKRVECADVIVDSGAFTELFIHGHYRHDVDVYALELHRIYTAGVVTISAAVAQDYMCEPFILKKTGMDIITHQRLTIERYDRLISELRRLFGGRIPFHVMPVLQGFDPDDYRRHLEMYGDRIPSSAWVGVGSVCKRQGDPQAILRVLSAIREARPDILLHGFGVKKTALKHHGVREYLATADSMAWSFAARKARRDGNDWREAKTFEESVNEGEGAPLIPWQMEIAI